MVSSLVQHLPIPRLRLLAGMAGAVLLVSGCLFQGAVGSSAPTLPTTGDTDGTGEPQITSLQNDLQVSGGQDLTIRYAIPDDATSIQAFRVLEGQSNDPGAFDFFTVVLSPGEGQFTIDTGDLPTGNYLIGIRYLDDRGATQTLFSTGVLRVESLPQPVFIEPSQNVSIQSGAEVNVIVDIGDVEGDVAWRLFFITQASAPDPTNLTGAQLAQLGNELATGEGNAASVVWTTINVAEGVYQLGVSATDSGFSVINTALAGDEDEVVTLYSTFTVTIGESGDGSDNPLAPTVVVTQPAGDRTLFGTEDIQVVFSAQTKEGTQNLVRVFYDDDTVFSNGILGTIAANLTTADTNASISSAALNQGTFFFGASVDDGINDPVASYAPGKVSVVTTPTLEVTEPSETRIVRPNDTVIVRWESNVPSSTASVTAFATLVGNSSAVPIEIPNTDESSATWNTNVAAGIYSITARMIFNDTTVADVTAVAPGLIRVSNAPPILWVGCFDDAANRPVECPDPEASPGVIFEAVQFEDSFGSAFAPAGDMDADGVDDFLMVARYGKPFFSNPDGIGHGEAYLIYGGNRLSGSINVNSVGGTVKGVTFTGIRTPQGNTETDGLSDVISVPDVDGDNRPELIFGFPDVESRGHNVDERQNGVVDPRTLITLERENQFMRGGIVIVSSQNSILRNPADPNQSPVMKLDMVGQDFDDTRVRPPSDDLDDDEASGLAGVIVELDSFRDDFIVDVWSFNEADMVCEGGCLDPMSDTEVDGNNTINFGFARALARDYFATYVYDAALVDEIANTFLLSNTVCGPFDYCRGLPPTCEPFSPGLHAAADAFLFEQESFVGFPGFFYPVFGRLSGFYPPFTAIRGPFDLNRAREPLGARIIGVGVQDKFGSTLGMSTESTGSAGSLIVAAPERGAVGILAGPFPGGCLDPTACGGEIDGLESTPGSPKTNPSSGVAYLFPVRDLWQSQIDVTEQNVREYPPKPHQYIVGEASHSCGGSLPQIDNVDAVRIAGDSNEEIRNLKGIPDFNGDGRDDFAVGSPKTDRVYIAFRRDPAIEGDYVLEKLELSINNAERLSGALITGNTGSQFAASMAADVDLNGDGVADLIVGAPQANGGVGEVVIIYASPDLITGQAGVSIETLIAQGRAARITGISDDGELSMFGFNVAGAGDIDGDGKNDLLISAPAGTPRYDSTPSDSDDTLDAKGLDMDGNGVQDDVTGIAAGNFGRPDGLLTVDDDLEKAGLVYIVWGSNVLSGTIGISELGSANLDGAIVVGRRPGDYFGGGDAGDVLNGGISAKMDRGRSAGLSAAGDPDGDGLADFLVGAVLASPRIDPETGNGTTHGGEAYLIYGFRR